MKIKMNYEQLGKTDEVKYLKLWKRYSVRGNRIPNGARVVHTDWAIQNGVGQEHDNRQYFKVRNRNIPYSILVKREDLKTPHSYWSGFWKEAPDTPVAGEK